MDVEDDDKPRPPEELECREPTLEDLVQLCRWLNENQAKYVVVGGFAIRAAGYVRNTMDVDLLIDSSLQNEQRVRQALSNLPDNAVRDVKPGEVAQYSVVRVADEYLVDLMASGCGITYDRAIEDAVLMEIEGVKIPFASPATLWRMKQTLREKDIPDKLFLRQWAEQNGVQLDPPPERLADSPASRSWLERMARWLRACLGSKR